MKITKCHGEGQGSCRRCEQTKGWNRSWMCFLYEIEGMEGCYCASCVKEIIHEANDYSQLKSALEIGIECGLHTVSEAMLNIKLHAQSMFAYSEIESRLDQLHLESEDVFSRTNFDADSSCEDLLNWLKIEDDGVREEELNL